MTKTKKLYLFAAVFLFLSVFFVGVDGVNNVVKADYCSVLCVSDSECLNACYIDESGGTTSWANGVTDDPYSSCDPFTDPTCCGDSGGYWYGGTCNTEDLNTYADTTGAYSYDQAQCNKVYGTGYVPNSDGTGCDASSVNSDLTCDARSSCMFWNCCPETPVQAQTPAQTAADKAAANAAQTKALAAKSVQNAATKIVNDKTVVMEQACSTGATQSEACIAAQKARDDAIKAYEKATEDAQAAIAEMDALSGTNYGSQSYGSTGNSIGGVSYGVNVGFGNVPGVSAGSAADCGEGFAKMGGVCFPTNTGLSNASVSSILSNLFLWLMGLFVTFAVVAFVVSGIQYLLAAGDEGMAETAKKNATNAIIGIIVGLSGFIIFKAIAAALSGQSYLF